MAMKLSTGILAIAIMTGAAWAQNPDAIDNVRSTMKSVQAKQTNDSNAALAASAPAQAPAAQPAAAPGTQSKPAAAAKSTAAPMAKPATGASAKPAAASAQGKPAAAVKSGAAVPFVKTVAASATPAVKPHDPMVPKTAQIKTVHAHSVMAAKPATAKPVATKIAAKAAEPDTKIADAIKTGDAAKPAKPEDKKWAMTGKRDPFFSPVVQQPTGSGCSTGKKCLEIGQINLRGVVHSDGGFIAVVTNTLNKAYFLHENDPVFNGYVVKITGDSVVFQETVQDKLGKSFTREVVKRLFTPAV
jgi:Tfp pilus assembly protein PilP